MATAKETTSQTQNAKNLASAVKTETKQAQADVKTGNVETTPQSQGGPLTDLPTGARSHPPE